MENNSCCCCGLGGTGEGYKTVSPEEFAKEITSPKVYLVDVRTPAEYAEGHIEGAGNLDVTAEDFIEKAKETLPKDKTIAVYCGSGKRSGMAATKLAAEGYDILNMDGGLSAWQKAGLPTVK